MVAANPFVDLPKYVVPFFEVDTFQEWGGKAYFVEFSIIKYVSCGLESEQSGLTCILREYTTFEILDYWSHLVVNSSHTIDGLEWICLMDTWLIREFDGDNLQDLSIFYGGESGQGICLGIL